MIKIIYAISTDPAEWSIETGDVPATLINRTEQAIRKYVARNWPEAEIEYRHVPETAGYGNRTTAYGDNDDEDREAETIIGYIDNFVNENWTGWLAEALNA